MNLIDKFNDPQVNLIISDYPERINPGEKNHGIAWYTHETTVPFAEKLGSRFVVLAEKGKNPKPELHAGKRILVLRVFDQKHHSLFPTILKWLLTFSKIKHVFIHSEFCTTGGIRNMALLMPFLLLIKMTGRKITFFEHNVINRFDALSTHFDLAPDSLKLKAYNFGIGWYYRALGNLVDRIVVMNEALKIRMEQYVSSSKVVCYPFWIQPKTYKLNYRESREKLKTAKNEFLIIAFGFITWYKGADWIIDQIETLIRSRSGSKNKKLKLILVGGEAYSLKDKEYYRKYFNEQLSKVNRQIQITGFVPESKVGLYFKAADLVVFPYRGFFGASGTLNYAISFAKPFLLSSALKEMTQNSDFRDSLKIAGLKQNDIFFNLNSKSFSTKLSAVQDEDFTAKLELLSRLLSQKRNIDDLLPKFYNEIYNIDNRAPKAEIVTELNLAQCLR